MREDKGSARFYEVATCDKCDGSEDLRINIYNDNMLCKACLREKADEEDE